VKSGYILGGYDYFDGVLYSIIFQSEDSMTSTNLATDPWLVYNFGFDKYVLSYTDDQGVNNDPKYYCLKYTSSVYGDSALVSDPQSSQDSRCQHVGDEQSFANTFLFNLFPTTEPPLTSRSPVQVFDLEQYYVFTHKSFTIAGQSASAENCLREGGKADSLVVDISVSVDEYGECGGSNGNSVFEFELTENNRYKITELKSGKMLMGTGMDGMSRIPRFELVYESSTMSPDIVSDPWLVYDYGNNRYALKHMFASYTSSGDAYPSSSACLIFSPDAHLLPASEEDNHCGIAENQYQEQALFGLYPIWIPPAVNFDSSILTASRLNKLTWRGSGGVSLCNPHSSVKLSILGITSIIYNWSEDGKMNALVDFTLGRSVQIRLTSVDIWIADINGKRKVVTLPLFTDSGSLHHLSPVELQGSYPNERALEGNYRVSLNFDLSNNQDSGVDIEMTLRRDDGSDRAKDCVSIARAYPN